jgi:hypothetical protein
VALHGTDRNITAVVHCNTLEYKYNSSECREITANSTRTCNREKKYSILLYNKKKSEEQEMN